MKIITLFLTCCLLTLSAHLKAQDATAQLTKLMDQATVAWNSNDLNGYMALYSPRATMMGTEGRSNVAGIRQIYEKYYFEGDKARQPLGYSNYEVTMLGKDHALMTGVFTLKATDKLKERKGAFSVVFRKEGNAWKILHDHSG